MKKVKIVIGIIIAIVALSSCTQHSCPTYGQVENEDDQMMFV